MAQCKQPQSLDLGAEQIAALEAILPLIRGLLANPAPMADVREELRTLQTALKRACDVINKIAKDKSPKCLEARVRIHIADPYMTRDAGILENESVVLSALLVANERALAELPKTQRRQVTNIRPIAEIDKALLRGFVAVHTQPIPPYKLRCSSSLNSPFRQIVGLCYEAVGMISDPERAIKAYIKSSKRRR